MGLRAAIRRGTQIVFCPDIHYNVISNAAQRGVEGEYAVRKEECTGARSARESLERIREQVAAFGETAQRAEKAMRPNDARRFLGQYEWLGKKVNAALEGTLCDHEAGARALGDAAVEIWRLKRVGMKAALRMNPLDAEPFENRFSYLASRLDEALALSGVWTVDLTGEIYSLGMAVTAVNAEEYGEDDVRIAQMVDPVVMLGGRVLRTGAVMLEPADA